MLQNQVLFHIPLHRLMSHLSVQKTPHSLINLLSTWHAPCTLKELYLCLQHQIFVQKQVFSMKKMVLSPKWSLRTLAYLHQQPHMSIGKWNKIQQLLSEDWSTLLANVWLLLRLKTNKQQSKGNERFNTDNFYLFLKLQIGTDLKKLWCTVHVG